MEQLTKETREKLEAELDAYRAEKREAAEAILWHARSVASSLTDVAKAQVATIREAAYEEGLKRGRESGRRSGHKEGFLQGQRTIVTQLARELGFSAAALPRPDRQYEAVPLTWGPYPNIYLTREEMGNDYHTKPGDFAWTVRAVKDDVRYVQEFPFSGKFEPNWWSREIDRESHDQMPALRALIQAATYLMNLFSGTGEHRREYVEELLSRQGIRARRADAGDDAFIVGTINVDLIAAVCSDYAREFSTRTPGQRAFDVAWWGERPEGRMIAIAEEESRTSQALQAWNCFTDRYSLPEKLFEALLRLGLTCYSGRRDNPDGGHAHHFVSRNVRDLLLITREDLDKQPGVGPATIRRFVGLLNDAGFALWGDPAPTEVRRPHEPTPEEIAAAARMPNARQIDLE